MEAFRDMVRGWLGKSLLVLLIVPFAIVGIESYFAGGGKVVAAKVNGTEILQSKVDELAERQRQQILIQMGANANPAAIDLTKLRKYVLDELISRELLTQQAHKDGYLVSDATIYKLINEEPSFHGPDGKFSQALFDQALRQSGESPTTYLATLKQGMSSNMLRSSLGLSGFATTGEIDRLSSLESQKRDIHVATVPSARYLADIQVSDAEVKKYYDANHPLFTTEETVALEYIQLKPADFLAAATPTEEELQERYDEKAKANANNEQRHARHILIKVGKTKDADALKKIQDIEKRVKAGEDFAKLAKEFSEDEGSVANGGDLGFTGRGAFYESFDKALFGLKEGEISAPVKSPEGYHLIKLISVEKTATPSFASLRPELEKEAKAAKADELFSDQVDKLDAAVYEAADLKEPAEKFKLAVATTAPFNRSVPPQVFASERKVTDVAFSDDLLKDGKSSQGMHLADGSVVWLHVKEHRPATLRPLAEISSDVRNHLLLEKAREKAKSVADSVIKALAGGASLADVAAAEKLTWQDLPEASRRTQGTAPGVLQLAYRLPRPAQGKISADSLAMGPSYAVVAVSRVVEGVPSTGPEVAQMRNVFAEDRSEQELKDYVRSLRENGKVVVNARKEEKTEE